MRTSREFADLELGHIQESQNIMASADTLIPVASLASAASASIKDIKSINTSNTNQSVPSKRSRLYKN